MKAVAYSIKLFEKEFLAKANKKKHDITLISNPLSFDTANYSQGKEVAIVFTNDDLSAHVIEKLASYGIKYILTRTVETDHIDLLAANKFGIQVVHIKSYSALAIAEHAVALAFALNRKLLQNEPFKHHFEYRNDEFIGFNFYGKTVGIIGLGLIGKAVANIYHGIGCKIIGYDVKHYDDMPFIKQVSINELLSTSDIISVHVPLNSTSKNLINRETIYKMKDGVMLINASRGAVLNTVDALAAIISHKIGYLGLDIYEYKYDGKLGDADFLTDPMLSDLLVQPNVLITPNQAYLTKEALQDIADQTINCLDIWQKKSSENGLNNPVLVTV